MPEPLPSLEPESDPLEGSLLAPGSTDTSPSELPGLATPEPEPSLEAWSETEPSPAA